MTTKKLVIILGSVLGGIVLLAALFAGVIVAVAFYTVGHSQAALTAKEFLRSNQQLKEEIGEVRDFGAFVTGSVNVRDSDGQASISLKVIGERRTVNATVGLSFKEGRAWRVTDASYASEIGKTIDLIEKYERTEPGP